MTMLAGAIIGAGLALAAVFLASRLLGFAAQRPEQYADLPGEHFDLRRHLSGPLICEGVIYGPLGRVTSRFVGEMQATWNGNQGVMKEHFRYESGKEERREWQLTLGNDGQILARASDLVGEATGWQRGPAVQLRYRIRLPEDAGGHILNGNDWMYLTPDGTIVNRSQFRKFGIKVAELVAVMRRKETV